EHIVILFGFLYFWYSKLNNETDAPARMAVLESAKHQWTCCDQEVFIAAIISNPFYGVTPFRKIFLTTHAGLAALFGCLWLRFYEKDAPVELLTDLEHYLTSFRDFTHMNMYKNSLLARVEATGKPIDALDVWNASSHPGSKPRPLHQIACRLLSICPNSASCE
ncbi:hypothetical protein HD554DRAFT_1997131, partial [Boletus coccyginus]